MTTHIKALSETEHTVKVQLDGYDVFEAVIKVNSANVECMLVTSGKCGGSDVPRLDTTGTWSVSVAMAETPEDESSFALWITEMGGESGIFGNLIVIGTIIDGYLSSYGESGYLGFSPTLTDVGTTIDYYLG